MTKTLAEMRKSRGLTKAEMAKRLGVASQQVTRIEAQFPDVMFTTIRRYMDALDVKIYFTGEGFSLESDEVEQDVTLAHVRATRRGDRSRRSLG